MTRLTLPALAFLATASAAWAQDDALLPTHLIGGGQVYATATARYIGNKGDAELITASGDFDSKFFQVQLDAGVGLGMGFEIDATIVYQFFGATEADFSSAAVEFESMERGFSDLIFGVRYGLLQEAAATPQLIIGAIVVAPVGNDKDGQTGTTVGGVETVDEKEGGIGQGVWRYGVEAGISKRLAFLEPYLTTNYVFGGNRKKDGVNENRADVWSATAGARWHLSPLASIDTRAIFSRPGLDKQENAGSQIEEEAHYTITGQASLFLRLGGPATLILGGGVTFVEEHELNDTVQLSLERNYAWFVHVGLHLLIGSRPAE
jgi:hypothetical protein